MPTTNSTETMTLCKIARVDAEHIMMSASAAGGWVAVSPTVVETVGGYLALLPSDWAEALRCPVGPVTAATYARRLEAVQHPLVERQLDGIREIARRIREHYGLEAV